MLVTIYWLLLYFAPVIIPPGAGEVQLKIRDLRLYEDKSRMLTFEQVSSPEFQTRFNKDLHFVPQDYNASSAYWVQLTVVLPDTDQNYLIEFFDQTIDSLNVYLKHESEEEFTSFQMGDFLDFSSKPIGHKNFEVPLTNHGKYTCFFRVASHDYADIRIAIRTYDRFVSYALSEYFVYGIFYGMILIISLYNLLIYTAIREIKYLYYTFYIISVGIFAMSVDGIAYQYLWPGSPQWNQIAHGVGLFLIIFWAILFSKKFLNLQIRSPRINNALNVVLAIRIVWFVYALVYDHELFQNRNIELIPLILIFVGSLSVYNRGYKPARFFIVAFGFLFIGFILKALIMMSIIPFTTISYYSLHIGFVFEMLFLTFALSDRVRILKHNRDRALRRIIEQHEENARYKDRMNAKLESTVEQRTAELKEKNDLLQRQKQEIAAINSLLDLDNWRLRNDIRFIQRDRLQNKELSYPEFIEVFDSRESCLEALSHYKWRHGYACIKCKNEQYSAGNAVLSRRCTRCGYQESPTTNTLFHAIKFPLEKAFYMLYETLNKDKYSLAELSEILDLRKNTVLNFKKRVRARTDEEKEGLNEIFKNLEDLPEGVKNL